MSTKRFNGKNYVVSGNSNGGTYVRLKGEGNQNFKPKELIGNEYAIYSCPEGQFFIAKIMRTK